MALALVCFFVFLLLLHVWLHLANPYARFNFIVKPFTTFLQGDEIHYKEHFTPKIYGSFLADLLGYYRQGFLIVQNTFFGGGRIKGDTSEEIIYKIHEQRFDPSKPYLISGDQFSVLYPRNLGVFYNQILDPDTALSPRDWENRQRIYLQSTLYAIEGLSDSTVPKTTLIPIGPRTLVTTQVHPGDVASDSPYGLLYSLDVMMANRVSRDGTYKIQTQAAIKSILHKKIEKLQHIIRSYTHTVQDQQTRLIKTDIHLSSARDGVSRKSSFYDNVILWKTLELADKLGIHKTSSKERLNLQKKIKRTYWNEAKGFYRNDLHDHSFSSDWLIGYVTGFFNLDDGIDRERTIRTIEYIEKNKLAEPLPIKYQQGKSKEAPFIIRVFVPSYGGNTIWSYWGAQYITLLIDLNKKTNILSYKDKARMYIKRYEEAITRDGGFAETYSPDGSFFRHGIYKSIRATGWVVQFEHAKKKFELLKL